MSRTGKTIYGLQIPCGGCEKRQIGCHSTCNEYLAYRNELDFVKDKVNADREMLAMQFDVAKARRKTHVTKVYKQRRGG